MRMIVEVDGKLMADALRVTGLKTKREAVELGLRTLLRLRQQEEKRRLERQAELLQWFGKLKWEGDLDAMRTDD